MDSTCITLLIVMFLLMVAEAVWFRVKLSKKEETIQYWIKDSNSRQTHMDALLNQLRKDNKKQLAAAKHRYYYYSATQAEQQRKHELRKLGVYYKRTLAGMEAGPVQYTEAFFADVTPIRHETRSTPPVPSYSDSKLVYEGHAATTILLPYDAQDNPVRKVVGQ